ncbi:uncharacterized protein PRCAT00002691001 [Priceomyces carsonii]|uniref:uncharacterized protein n=1 Tax=Priceomyces carsonii TaxID=28549 RepID=UPI002ED8544B|nr:unnamed protein product [Priceomyces carsonii]
MTGLFYELGPSKINLKLEPELNEYSWNNNASVIFLDQPLNTGFSYSKDNVDSSASNAKDVYDFLDLFFETFPQYSKLGLHLAGESYSGHFIPAIAREILNHENLTFNLSSIMIGNGLTDPYIQFQYYEIMACKSKEYKLNVSSSICKGMSSHTHTCELLTKACYKFPYSVTCYPSTAYCMKTELEPFLQTGINPYDVRLDCAGDGSCYEDMIYYEEYLNQTSVQKVLGVDMAFQSCSDRIYEDFIKKGDWSLPSQENIKFSLDRGVPVLIFAGDQDFMCNWLGNHAWTKALEWDGQASFSNSKLKPWYVEGEEAGQLKNSEHFSFLRIYNAGHMTSYDQPRNSLAMVNSWVHGDFALGN